MAVHASLFLTYYNFSFSISLIDSLIFNGLVAGMGMSFWFVVKYSSTDNQKFTNSILSLIGSTIIAVLIITFVGEWLSILIIPDPDYIDFVRNTIVWRTIISTLYMAFVIMFYYLIKHQANLKLKEEEELKLQSLLKQAELDVLKFQINPHFIFNSLNSISSLTISSPTKAQEMVIKLSDFLRSSLGKDNKHIHTLREELNQMHLYLDIEKIRFEDRLRLDNVIAEECLSMSIPSMILQPLYENAIKYAVYESIGNVSVDTHCFCEGADLFITISNSYSEDAGSHKGKGIGLNNIKTRLALLYNDSDLLQIEKNEGIFKVTMRIPQDR